MKKIADWLMRTFRGFRKNDCPLHAAGLTYFALLAVVPVLCCILVTAKACGLDRHAKSQINGRIDAAIANIERGQDDPLAKLTPQDEAALERKRIAAGEFARQARRVSDELFSRVDKFDVGTFGWIGFGLLVWTVISTLASVETCFNGIFDVKKPRPIWKRAYMYPALMIVLPILSAVAMSLPVLNVVKGIIVSTMGATWLTKWVSDGLIWFLDSIVFRLSFTLATASISFGFFLWIMPNCKVRFVHALYGGLITAVLFGGWMKACAVAQIGIAKSSALYGSFAFLPIVLAWNYVSWQIVLLGANMVRAFGPPGEEPAKEGAAS